MPDYVVILIAMLAIALLGLGVLWWRQITDWVDKRELLNPATYATSRPTPRHKRED